VGKLWIETSDKRGSGQKIENYGICVIPGSLLSEKTTVNLSNEFSAFGIGIAVVVDK